MRHYGPGMVSAGCLCLLHESHSALPSSMHVVAPCRCAPLHPLTLLPLQPCYLQLLSEYRKEYIERSVPFPHEADRIPELDGKSYVESVAPLDGRSVYTTTYPAHPLQLPKSTKPAAAAAGGARDRLFEGLSTYKHDYPAKVSSL